MTAAIGVAAALVLVALIRTYTRRRDPLLELGAVESYRRARRDDGGPVRRNAL